MASRSSGGNFDPTAVLGWTALGVSLLLHVGLAVLVMNRPIAAVDPALLDQPQRLVQVRRADPSFELPPVFADEGQAQDTGPTAEDLSRELMQRPEPPLAASETIATPRLRAPEDQRPDAAGPEAPDAAIDDLLPQQIAELMELDGQPAGGAAPDPLGDGDAGLPGSSAMAAALEGIGGGSGTGGPGGGFGGGGGGPALADAASSLTARPELDRGPDLDRRPIDLPIAAPAIDIAGLALADTTQLEVPEHLDNDFDIEVRRYDGDRRADGGYFQVELAARRSLRRLHTMPKDVVFLIDTSSSVPQDWVEQVVRGVRESLPSLNDGDRFNIVLFSEQVRFLSEERLISANRANLDRARAFLDEAGSEGYTDVNAALRRLLSPDEAMNRVTNLILISDGRPTRGVVDTRDLINLITRDNDLTASIYCVGVGDRRRQNRELLDFLAYRNRGFSVYADRESEVVGVIAGLTSRLRYPIIRNVQLYVSGVDGNEVYPRNLPNIHQGERFRVFGRYGRPVPFTMTLTGTSDDQAVDITFTRDLMSAQRGGEAIAGAWAFRKLHFLYSEIIRLGERQELLDQIEQLRRRYDLRTLY